MATTRGVSFEAFFFEAPLVVVVVVVVVVLVVVTLLTALLLPLLLPEAAAFNALSSFARNLPFRSRITLSVGWG